MKIMCVTEREGPASEGWRQGEDLNWNAGHRAARRFRFCLRSPLQVGNPPDTKCILIKIQDTPTSPAEIEARRLNGDRQNTWPTWQAILTERASGAISGRFVQAQRERSDEGAGVIGLMFECMAIRFLFKSSDSLIRPGSGSLIIFQRRLIKDGGTAGMKMNESQARWGHFQFSFQKLRCNFCFCFFLPVCQFELLNFLFPPFLTLRQGCLWFSRHGTCNHGRWLDPLLQKYFFQLSCISCKANKTATEKTLSQ